MWREHANTGGVKERASDTTRRAWRLLRALVRTMLYTLANIRLCTSSVATTASIAKHERQERRLMTPRKQNPEPHDKPEQPATVSIQSLDGAGASTVYQVVRLGTTVCLNGTSTTEVPGVLQRTACSIQRFRLVSFRTPFARSSCTCRYSSISNR